MDVVNFLVDYMLVSFKEPCSYSGILTKTSVRKKLEMSSYSRLLLILLVLRVKCVGCCIV